MNLAEQAKAEARQLIADVQMLLEECRKVRDFLRLPRARDAENDELLKLLNAHQISLCGLKSDAMRMQSTLNAACVCRQMEGPAIELPDRKRLAANDHTFEEERN